MQQASGRSAARASGLSARQLGVIGVLLALAGIAWVTTARRMGGMDGGPGTDPGALGFYVGIWVVMMAAMMLPAVTPAVVSYSDLRRERMSHRSTAQITATGLFVAGYLAVWALAGLAGYAVLEAGRSLDGGLFGWDRAGRWAAAGVLLAATLYQLTPAKRACLTQCRDARAFLLAGRLDGHEGGLETGIRHGAWCLGCCWMLMAALFALGAMSLAWMAVVAVLIAGERLLPWRRLGAIGVASVLAALTIGVAAGPERIPGLTIPGSAAGMRAMGMTTQHHTRMADPKPMAPSVAPGRR